MNEEGMLLVVLSVFCLVAVPVLAYPEEEVVNLVLNPSFEDKSDIVNDQWIPDGWVTWGEGDGLASVVEFDESEFIDGATSLRIEPTGTVNWHFMVIYYPVAQNLGETYTVSFWAKAEEERPVSAKIKATDNSVDVVIKDFQLTTEWEEYTFTYEAGAVDIKLEIWVSEFKVPLWLDFVYLYEGEYVADILPSEAGGSGEAVQPAGKLAIRWAELKVNYSNPRKDFHFWSVQP